MEQTSQVEQNINAGGGREAGMETSIGAQGVGKTYLNMHIISQYIQDKLHSKVMGRKALIFDTNGEYTKEQFADNGLPNFPIKNISVKDIGDWSRSDVAECRRVDAKNLKISEKKKIIEYIIEVYKNGMLVLEDINTYILSLTHIEEIVGGLVNLRHRAVDVLISYQGLRAVEPVIIRNSRWVRMHFQADDIEDVKGKIADTKCYKIAQILVNNQYFSGNERFYATITLKRKIEGEFSKRHFDEACKEYFNLYPKEIKQQMSIKKCSEAEAIKIRVMQCRSQYYGN